MRVYVETPDERDGFHGAVCWLPEHRWEDVRGYTPAEMTHFQRLVRNNAHLIMDSSRDGGVLCATAS